VYWSEQIPKSNPRPFGEALGEEFRISGMQFETWDQTPVGAVHFAKHPAFTTTTRDLSKTAKVVL
jgi:hypothetical protein